MVTIAEYASEHGISPRRVRTLAQHGRLPARRVGRAWVLDEAVSATPVAGTRPMSARTRALFLRALSDQSVRDLVGTDRRRTAGYLNRLRSAEHPAALLRAWFRGAPVPGGFTLGELLVRAAMDGDDDIVAERLARPQRRFMNTSARLSRIVADERAIHGWTRAELATRAGVAEHDVQAIESGAQVETLLAILRVLTALDVQPLALPTEAVRSPT